MKKKHYRYLVQLFFFLISSSIMAQSDIIISNKNSIISKSEDARSAALLLKKYLDKAFVSPFGDILNSINKDEESTAIILEISNQEKLKPNEFIIKSDAKSIYLIAQNSKYLRYAVYTLLEIWEFRKFTASETYIPKVEQLTFSKNTKKNYQPAFDYRALFYPDCYDEAFREWHKLDWQVDDFGIC
jgi:hypothetical protein